jgi:antitoxin (DNA-binding transcriptional repressor) of toxin-antitoxin stability system
MEAHVSKSRFKARALEYFRQVERTGQGLIITDRDRPVLEIRPYRPDPEAALRKLRGSVLRYDDPLEPVGLEDWEALQ